MKKFLSLVLALVMTMSLVTVSAGAKDFGDSADLSGEAYEEAVNVMSEMGIIDGYSDGDFRPQGTLTRGAAAKIIACMMLGKTTAEALGTSAAPFKDVPAGSTFAGYIAYCVESGLIDGYADGTFRPQNTLTGFAFLKMLLTALGYDSAIEGYTGTNWTVNVAGRATQVGLTDGNEDFVGTRAATREEACLYAVNALKATLVEYESKGTNVTVNGATVAIGASKPTYITSSIAGAATSIDDTRDNQNGDYTVEFAERYQPDLELTPDTDAFGRPSHTWSWDNKDIGTYIDYDLLVAEYTTKVTGEDLYDELGRTALKEYDTYVYIDGVADKTTLDKSASPKAYFDDGYLNKNNKTTVGGTGNGVLTQVFVDGDDEEIVIAVINTYLAQANGDYNEKQDRVSYTVYGIDNKGTGSDPIYVKEQTTSLTLATADAETITVYGEDHDIADVEEDEFALVTVADGTIQTIADPEILSDSTLTAFSKGKYVVTGGETYDYADTVEYNPEVLDDYTGVNGATNLKELSYNVYLDQYGYMIGIDLVEEADNYIFLTGIDTGYSNLANKTADAAGILLDGSFNEIQVNMSKSKQADGTAFKPGALINTWCTYTVNKDGVYTLTEVGNGSAANYKIAQNADIDYRDKDIDKKHVSLAANPADSKNYVYGNDATVYLTAELSKVEAKDTMVSGYGNYYDHNSAGVIANKPVGIISGVENVTVGIKNASLHTWTGAEILDALDETSWGTNVNESSSGVYTLYKSNGYVIAAVVVGEDDSVSDNLVFAHTDDVEQEGYNSTDDEWTWSRKVIYQGEEIEVYERGSELETLDQLTQGEWYMLKYNGDGEVIDFEPASSGMAPAYTNDVDQIENKINNSGKETVLYADEQLTSTKAPSLVEQTLYVDTIHQRGFYVSEDVKVVMLQTNDGKDYTYFGEGVSDLEGMLEDLNLVSGNYKYTINAIIEGGAATVVVIEDGNPIGATVNPGHGPSGDVKVTGMSFSASGMKINFKNETGVQINTTDHTIYVTVTNAAGSQVYSGYATAFDTVNDNANGSATFGGYTGVASTSGNFTVTVTVTNPATGATYSGSNTIGTI